MSADQTIVHKPRIRRSDEVGGWFCFGSASGRVHPMSHPWNFDIVGGSGKTPSDAYLDWVRTAAKDIERERLSSEFRAKVLLDSLAKY